MIYDDIHLSKHVYCGESLDHLSDMKNLFFMGINVGDGN